MYVSSGNPHSISDLELERYLSLLLYACLSEWVSIWSCLSWNEKYVVMLLLTSSVGFQAWNGWHRV